MQCTPATVTDRLKKILGSTPYKDVWCGTATAIVTFWGEPTARRFTGCLKTAGIKHRIVESVDYTKSSEGRAMMRDDLVKVWRVGITW